MAHSSWGGPGVGQGNLTRILGVPGIPLYVHREVGTIHQYLANNLKKLRQPGAPSLNSSGGYVKRYIAGTKVWSNHSWALATDYNAPTNPYSRNGSTDFKVAETRRVCASLEGMRWGWDYAGKKDAMHFEWITSRVHAAQVTDRLLRSVTVDSNAFTVDSSGAKVREIELKLKMLGYGGFSADDKFDAATSKAVVEFQKLAFPNKPVEQDGIVGKNTLSALEFWPLKLEPAPAKTYVNEFPAGETLLPGQTLVSANKKNTLALQTDGNLVLYGPSGATWSTGISGNILAMQADGNCVLYLSDGIQSVPVWHTNTSGAGIEMRLALQDDGNLVMYGTRAFWSTNTF